MSTDRSGHWDDLIVDQTGEQGDLRETGKILSPASELVWGDTRMGHNALAVSPLTGYALRTLHAHIDVIAAGGATGKHRHASEAVMLCVDGEGYSVIDGRRFDWAKGDVFVVPSASWHQHFNRSDTHTATYFAVTNWPLTAAIGLSYQDYTEPDERGNGTGAAPASVPAEQGEGANR